MQNSDQPKRPPGRPKGSLNRMARETRERAAQSGKLPHEILLEIARGEPQSEKHINNETGEIVIVWLAPAPLEMRVDAAKAAAPYFAPKISTVEVIQGVGDEDLDAIIARAAAEAGVSLGFDGEGEEGEAEGRAATSGRTRERVRVDFD